MLIGARIWFIAPTGFAATPPLDAAKTPYRTVTRVRHFENVTSLPGMA